MRRFLDGTGPLSGIGIVFLVVGPILLLSILLTPHGWQWWLDAKSVPGHEAQGIVYYTFEGQRWTIDDTGSATRTGPRTVYVIAADPADGALTNTPTVALDWSVTCGPIVAGLALLSLGFRRRSVVRRRSAESIPTGYGSGIPSEVIRRITTQRYFE